MSSWVRTGPMARGAPLPILLILRQGYCGAINRAKGQHALPCNSDGSSSIFALQQQA